MQRLLTDYFDRAPAANEPQTPAKRLRLTDLCLPMQCVRARREGKFVVRVVPLETVSLCEELLMRVNTDGATMTRLYDQFKEFRVLNGLNDEGSKARSLWLFIIDCFVQGLKASSCKTYCSLLLEAHRRSGAPFSGPLVGDLVKALALLHCEEETEHAPDIPLETAWTILRTLGKEFSKARLTIFLLLALGCRCADAENLVCEDIRINNDGSISISYGITKNHRCKLKSYSIRIRPRELIPELSAIVSAPVNTPIPHLSATELNRVLAAEVPKMNLGNLEGLTSYSFRRAFIQDIVGRHKSEDGSLVDWLGVARFTGHNNLDVLRVAYTQRFENTL